ncbi:hypothetical protein ALC56_13089, partial [Trachymyrmex septentrionalis]
SVAQTGHAPSIETGSNQKQQCLVNTAGEEVADQGDRSYANAIKSRVFSSAKHVTNRMSDNFLNHQHDGRVPCSGDPTL